MIKDYFNFAFGSIRHRQLRSWLTILGIIIGIAAVVALISLGQGFKQAINKEFEKLGTDKLIVTAKSGFSAPGVTAVKDITKDDLKVIKNVNGVKNAAGIMVESAKVEFKNEVGFFSLHSLPKGGGMRLLAESQLLNIDEGRELKDNDKFNAVVGLNFAKKELLGKNLRPQDRILINNQKFTVVGIFKSTGDPVHDSSVFIPEDTLRDILNVPDKFNSITVKVTDVNSIDIIAERIKDDLRRFRGVKKDEEDFDVQSPEDLLGDFFSIISIVQAVIIGIAAISLIVGGIGIANTMYTAVLERTKEIGIMKSVGARNRDIMLIFIIESGLIGAIGGLAGVMIGMGLSKSVEYIAQNVIGTTLVEAYFSYTLFFGALLFSFLIGAIFGVMPARQAALMQPVEALRSK